jgi:DNA-binding GntR family transcriptional regulator
MPSDGLVHQRIIASFVERGRPPSLEELANELGTPAGVVGDALRRLETEHGVVLHPGSTEVWIAHPFSASPTGV